MKPILTIDYKDWTEGTEEQKKRFVEQIMESLQTTGYVKCVNHPFDNEKLDQIFEWSHRFFDQPVEVKNQIENETNPHRGYTGYGVENSSNLAQGDEKKGTKDSKEHFDQGPSHDDECPNKWPKNLPGFRPFMEAFYDQCDEVCLTLVKALEAGLGVTDECITKRCIPSDTDFRLTHYPAIPVAELQSGRRIRIASHVDFGVISILFQDGVGGLEVEDRDKPGSDSFIPIMPSNHKEMLVNLGATMQRWTNDKMFGGLHRVAIPAALKNATGNAVIPARTSVAYLFKAQRDVSVGPLDNFISEKNPARYPDMTGIEYHKWRNSQFY